MSKATRIHIILITVGVVLAGALGVFAGMWILEWRSDRATAAKLVGLDRGEGSKLRAGEPIPNVELVDLSGTATSTRILTAQAATLFVFVSIHCDPCTEVLQTWRPYVDKIPREVQMVGICQDAVEYARVYAARTGFGFPLYCDTSGVFDHEYDMNIYPTLLAVHKGGTTAFIRHGFDEDYSPPDAVNQLIASE